MLNRWLFKACFQGWGFWLWSPDVIRTYYRYEDLLLLEFPCIWILWHSRFKEQIGMNQTSEFVLWFFLGLIIWKVTNQTQLCKTKRLLTHSESFTYWSDSKAPRLFLALEIVFVCKPLGKRPHYYHCTRLHICNEPSMLSKIGT